MRAHPLFRPLMILVMVILSHVPAHASPEFWRHEWPDTDFSKTTVPTWLDIISGGPGKDGIPALDTVAFHPVTDEQNITGSEPVLVLAIPGETPRAYPLRYLMWHEIANDMVGDIPVAITFCPLCNSAVVFDRRVDGQILTFGVTGKLRHSDMVMYDRETQSWWQQAEGRGIVGEMSGVDLISLPSWLSGFDTFAQNHPEGLVMTQPAYRRDYGRNPYAGYDSSTKPFLFSGEPPPNGVPALARVIRVGSRAWPLERLADLGEIREVGVTLTWATGQGSALDTSAMNKARDVGNVRVRNAQGQDMVHDVMFAFAFHAFWPDGTWMLGP